MNRDLCIICASSFKILKVSRFCWVWQVFSYLFLFIHMKPNRVLESSTSWELSGKLVEKCWQNSIPFEMMFRRTDDNISTDHDDQGSHVWHHGITLTAFTGNFHTVIWIYYILHAETTSACKWNMFWHPQTTADEWVEGQGPHRWAAVGGNEQCVFQPCAYLWVQRALLADGLNDCIDCGGGAIKVLQCRLTHYLFEPQTRDVKSCLCLPPPRSHHGVNSLI